ncbi:MFS transporter [Paraburkholderia oxyphila]|uniref:MFS transporter n=1 Tax=Paraburkholderia oxyphila TaxID=614212 RepID=UPI000481D56D|nr:MFS transporter [Paraburkholderia oxyphila]
MSAFLDELRGGWRDLIGAVIGLGLGIGAYNPVSSFFFRALEHEFGWSKAAAAVSLIALPVTAAVLPFAGLLLDRFGVRRVAALSTICMSACFVWLSAMNGQLWTFYAAFIVLNVLGCATGPVSYTRTISTRFRKSRGTALAFSLLGIGMTAMILPPLIAAILAHWGWRGGYRFFAAAVLVGGLLALALSRGPVQGASAPDTLAGDRLATAATKRAFWLLGMAIFGLSVASLGFVSQFQSIAIEKGLAPATAPFLLSALAASVLVSRLVIGGALDALRPERVAATALCLAALGMLLWMFSGPHAATALIAVLLIGLSIGAELDFLSFFCARLFGLRHYGAVYGGLAAFFYTGIATGGIAYGVIHDRTGGYVTALLMSAALFVVAALIFLTLGPAMRDAERAQGALVAEAPGLDARLRQALRMRSTEGRSLETNCSCAKGKNL